MKAQMTKFKLEWHAASTDTDDTEYAQDELLEFYAKNYPELTEEIEAYLESERQWYLNLGK